MATKKLSKNLSIDEHKKIIYVNFGSLSITEVELKNDYKELGYRPVKKRVNSQRGRDTKYYLGQLKTEAEREEFKKIAKDAGGGAKGFSVARKWAEEQMKKYKEAEQAKKEAESAE